jgi:hypothetical protein
MQQSIEVQLDEPVGRDRLAVSDVGVDEVKRRTRGDRLVPGIALVAGSAEGRAGEKDGDQLSA